MVNVLITIDTELWPPRDALDERTLRHAMLRDIDGRTPQGEFGVGYQTDVLNRSGLTAVFLVESLFASAVGIEPLARIVRLVRDGRQEVQMHLHPEWLGRADMNALGPCDGPGMKDYSLSRQAAMIRRGLANLHAAGAGEICAFRAGGYGANLDTLAALARAGITFDTSHNAAWLGATCEIRTQTPLLGPAKINGVWELPVTCFADWPGHCRHAELCACSSSEMEHALLSAHRQGWGCFVIVSHSFELIRRSKDVLRPPTANRMNIRRFERLCRFLADNRDKFRTCGFNGLEVAALSSSRPPAALRSSIVRTAGRYVQQAVQRLSF